MAKGTSSAAGGGELTDRRTRLPLNAATVQWAREAEAMGVPVPSLIVADLARLRGVLRAHEPTLTAWEWRLVSHVMDSEAMALIADPRSGEAIVSAARLARAIRQWADGADETEMLQAERLAARAEQWMEIERWALMVRARPR